MVSLSLWPLFLFLLDRNYFLQPFSPNPSLCYAIQSVAVILLTLCCSQSAEGPGDVSHPMLPTDIWPSLLATWAVLRATVSWFQCPTSTESHLSCPRAQPIIWESVKKHLFFHAFFPFKATLKQMLLSLRMWYFWKAFKIVFIFLFFPLLFSTIRSDWSDINGS